MSLPEAAILGRFSTRSEPTHMQVEVSKPLSGFGFLTAIEDSLHGFFGGYLIVSTTGRPIEFHCTTPVLPNPAQEILYGASLRPYLLGELIGLTLLTKAKTPVQMVLTDQDEMLANGSATSIPLALVREASPSESEVYANGLSAEFQELQISGYSFKTIPHVGENKSSLQALIEQVTRHIDPLEPFQRIREAIDEAQRVSEPTDEQSDESSAAA